MEATPLDFPVAFVRLPVPVRVWVVMVAAPFDFPVELVRTPLPFKTRFNVVETPAAVPAAVLPCQAAADGTAALAATVAVA